MPRAGERSGVEYCSEWRREYTVGVCNSHMQARSLQDQVRINEVSRRTYLIINQLRLTRDVVDIRTKIGSHKALRLFGRVDGGKVACLGTRHGRKRMGRKRGVASGELQLGLFVGFQMLSLCSNRKRSVASCPQSHQDNPQIRLI